MAPESIFQLWRVALQLLGSERGTVALTIQSWRSDRARAIFEGRSPGKGFPPDLVKSTRRRLLRLNDAVLIDDLLTPPSHRLHKLDGDRAGEWSISVNDQFRITFTWGDNGPEQVWFGDYH